MPLTPESKKSSLASSILRSPKANMQSNYNEALRIQGNDPVRAFTLFNEAFQSAKAAAIDFPEISYHIGMCYLHGEGTRKNLIKAAEFLFDAAKDRTDDFGNIIKYGMADAQYQYARLHMPGSDSIVNNLPFAVHWIQMAAEVKHPDAMYVYAYLHATAQGGLKLNYSQAAFYYGLAKKYAPKDHVFPEDVVPSEELESVRKVVSAIELRSVSAPRSSPC